MFNGECKLQAGSQLKRFERVFIETNQTFDSLDGSIYIKDAYAFNNKLESVFSYDGSELLIVCYLTINKRIIGNYLPLNLCFHELIV